MNVDSDTFNVPDCSKMAAPSAGPVVAVVVLFTNREFVIVYVLDVPNNPTAPPLGTLELELVFVVVFPLNVELSIVKPSGDAAP
ncbi:MAG: hypothetical protein ACR2N4_02460 [Jatrophihabitans sp.]